MADIKWIKITVDMFDNRKIKHIRRQENGNDIALMWVMLLTIAGRCNDGGAVYLTKDIPYTEEMLSDELLIDEETVKTALKTLEKMDMISIDNDDFIYITGWEEYQNVEKMDKAKQQSRERKARYDAKKRTCSVTSNANVTLGNASSNVTSNVTSNAQVTQSNATEEEEEIDIDIKKKDKKESADYGAVVQMYNTLCKSFPSVRTLSESRKKAIRARLRVYSMADFETVFKKAEASNFLKGANNKNWSATFDWLIKDANMAKVLDCNYDNDRQPNNNSQQAKEKRSFQNFTGRQYDMHEMEKRILEAEKRNNET